MRSAIRCCISCILPCGAFDVIRIVHIDGHVEEISHGGVTAAEIMKLHPKHVLRKPLSSPEDAGAGERSKIAVHVVSPDALLKRGEIYFLIPLPLPPPREKTGRRSAGKRKKKESGSPIVAPHAKVSGCDISVTNFLTSQRYLSESLSENISMDRRRRRAAVWRPRLESISETPAEA